VLQILKLLEEAVNAGFAAALTIDSTSVEGLLGLGDAHLAAGKLLANSGNVATANIHWKQSSEAFMKASKFLAAGNLDYPSKVEGTLSVVDHYNNPISISIQRSVFIDT